MSWGRPLLAVVLLLWPVCVWFGLQMGTPRVLALGLLVVLGLRFWASPAAARRRLLPLLAVGVSLALVGVAFNHAGALLLYPVLVNVVFLLWFGRSLFTGMPVIEQLARLQEPELPASGVAWTRKVTQVWCGFFAVNGLLAAWTVWQGDLALWTLYNGLIAYLVMGLLFAGEWLLRQRMRRRERLT